MRCWNQDTSEIRVKRKKREIKIPNNRSYKWCRKYQLLRITRTKRKYYIFGVTSHFLDIAR